MRIKTGSPKPKPRHVKSSLKPPKSRPPNMEELNHLVETLLALLSEDQPQFENEELAQEETWLDWGLKAVTDIAPVLLSLAPSLLALL